MCSVLVGDTGCHKGVLRGESQYPWISEKTLCRKPSSRELALSAARLIEEIPPLALFSLTPERHTWFRIYGRGEQGHLMERWQSGLMQRASRSRRGRRSPFRQ